MNSHSAAKKSPEHLKRQQWHAAFVAANFKSYWVINAHFFVLAPGLLGTYTAACITFMSGGRESAYRLGIMQDINPTDSHKV